MNTEPHADDGAVKSAAKVFWRTRQFWTMITLIILGAMLVGYLVGNWTATTQARHMLSEQERAYNEASDSRKVILSQCLTNNAKLTTRLAELGEKASTAATTASDAAKNATDAVNKLSSEEVAK